MDASPFFVSPFPFESTLGRIWWQSRCAQAMIARDTTRRRVAWIGNLIFSGGTRTAVLLDE